MKNKIIATLVALTMLGQVTLTASAISTSGGMGESLTILNQEQTSFKVTVPTSLPITVNSAGVVTTATDAKIRNNSYGPMVISDVQVDVANGWSIVDFNKDMGKSKLGLKEFGFSIQNDKVQANGSVALTPTSWESIPGNGSMQLTYDAIISPQKTALSDVNIANVVFILGWDEREYTLAKDSDFEKTWDPYQGLYVHYIGTDEYVEMPHVIQGETVYSYVYMFIETSVKGVKSTNTNVTDMSGMFSNSQATSLDLSNFDTSNVTNMEGMFYKSQATTIDLSSFDTSQVHNMRFMFNKSQATTIDLSSFDTSQVTTTLNMFKDSKATNGYARTQADAHKLNLSTNKPAGLTFIVK